MSRHIVGAADEIGLGQRKIVEANGISIGVFNVNGVYYALRNRCPHQGAPLCQGSLKGTTLPSQPGEYVWSREGEILRCPWHGWEFDVRTGRSLCNPQKMRVRTYDVTLETGPEIEDDPSVDTFVVTVEVDQVVLHLPSSKV